MNWIDTPDSSHLKCCGYDAESKELRVQFRAGDEYAYSDVPPEVWSGLQSAKSKGSFFGEKIRGVFTSSRVGDPQQTAGTMKAPRLSRRPR